MIYQPTPIDTSAVELSPDLLQLTELLAKNTHDIWAMQRMNDGWSFGPVRNDAKKEHPCLIAYDELPESEREYDRKTALETLRLIVALGFRITR